MLCELVESDLSLNDKHRLSIYKYFEIKEMLSVGYM